MKKAWLMVLLGCLLWPWQGWAQSKSAVDAQLRSYFSHYEAAGCRTARPKLAKSVLNNPARTLDVYANAAFGEQPFREESVKQIYDDVRALLPSPVNRYKVTIYVGDKSIDSLVPNRLARHPSADRAWGKGEHYDGAPWVTDASRPYTVTEGLQGHHLAINASHGAVFSQTDRRWGWQRPALFCTREDLLTQSIVYPYLIPMLENAGAVVFTTRERDPQPAEVVVDNDVHGCEGGLYVEEHGSRTVWTDTADGLTGFFTPQDSLFDGDNPHVRGTARFVNTTSGRGAQTAAALWMPRLPRAGRYAVYVTYTSCARSVPDAHYVVTHKGGTTHFTVNQQMGSGTWTYLGTFEFDAGASTAGMVALTNESRYDGVVCADAVRFGGGMGLTARGISADSMRVSTLPRYFEGARYWAQYAGFPYAAYAGKGGLNDYAEDINARSYVGNHLLGGSVFCPDSVGLGVPLELAFALHTDAGLDREGIVGTLGICTTAYHDGLLGDGRTSRFTSRDMVDEVMSSVTDDIRRSGHPEWTRRGIWDRNYSESRICEVPSMILEVLAHQNYNDMKLAHDPKFKFLVARAVYKGLLRQVSATHGEAFTVQPLPPDHLLLAPSGRAATGGYRLSWQPVADPLEPSAQPTAYVVYTRVGDGGFDNGRLVKGTHLDMELQPDVLYSFRVTAVNKGGQSFPSETLAAGYPSAAAGSVLVVNGFQRLDGPATVETADSVGFDLDADPGVPYISTMAFCGRQTDFNPASVQLGPDRCTHGASTDELIGKTLVGNTFDFTALHAAAILANGYAVASASRQCFEEGAIALDGYQVVDVLLGLENKEVLPAAMHQRLASYAMGGGRLLLSGSYIGDACRTDPSASIFMRDILRVRYVAANRRADDLAISGQNLTLPFERGFNTDVYPLVRPEVLEPAEPSDTDFSLFAYAGSRASAAVAAQTATTRAVTLGFPFEAVGDATTRQAAMAIILAWLMKT